MTDNEIRLYVKECTEKLDSIVKITMAMFMVSIVLTILALIGVSCG